MGAISKRETFWRPSLSIRSPLIARSSSEMSSKGKKETLSKKSAAEFFSEHQQIAGFDNPGKSLFTTIREFVENSLDAAESMHVLPDIELCVEEFSEAEHNELNGIRTNGSKADLSKEDDGEPAEKPVGKSSKASKGDAKESKEQMYYLIRCTDNGCGIPEENIGDMLGRVLSGSKHGIRQTRGKFGLGAKMVRSSLLSTICCMLCDVICRNILEVALCCIVCSCNRCIFDAFFVCSTGSNLVQEVIRPTNPHPHRALAQCHHRPGHHQHHHAGHRHLPQRAQDLKETRGPQPTGLARYRDYRYDSWELGKLPLPCAAVLPAAGGDHAVRQAGGGLQVPQGRKEVLPGGF